MSDILERTIFASLVLDITEDNRFKEKYYKSAVSFTKSHHARIELAAAMALPSALDMNGITTATSLLLKTDGQIKVGIDSSTNLITLSTNGMISIVGEFSAVYVQNENPDYTAAVDFVFTD